MDYDHLCACQRSYNMHDIDNTHDSIIFLIQFYDTGKYQIVFHFQKGCEK